MKLTPDFTDKNIWIIWFWKEWKSTLRHLKEAWAKHLTILDKRTPDSMSDEELHELTWTNAILWDCYLDHMDRFDTLVKAPWVSPYDEKLVGHRAKIIDQTQIFFDHFKWKIIAVTWTKWKSTTTSLIYELLKNAWLKVWVVGNIWKPALDYLDEEFEFVVYELSSYMLELAKINPFICKI